MGSRAFDKARSALGAGTAAALLTFVAACVSSNTSGPPPAGDAGLTIPGFDASTGSGHDASTGADANAPADDAGSGGDDGGILSVADSGACGTGFVQGTDGLCYVNLQGAWSASSDANNDGPDTVATLSASTPRSVTVAQSHTGQDYADCGCNAQHLAIDLGRSFPCATTTLAFDYATTVQYGSLNTPAVDIRFCDGACAAPTGFQGGPQFVGSVAAPISSSCAYEWENDAGTASLNVFPASAAISTTQTNVIALGTYVAPAAQDQVHRHVRSHRRAPAGLQLRRRADGDEHALEPARVLSDARADQNA